MGAGTTLGVKVKNMDVPTGTMSANTSITGVNTGMGMIVTTTMDAGDDMSVVLDMDAGDDMSTVIRAEIIMVAITAMGVNTNMVTMIRAGVITPMYAPTNMVTIIRAKTTNINAVTSMDTCTMYNHHGANRPCLP